MRKMLLLLLACAYPAAVHGTTYYAAADGSGGTTCSAAQSASHPVQGIAAGIACLQSGDTLILAPGTYTESIPACTIPSGSSGQPTVIRAAQPRQTILRGTAYNMIDLGGGCTQQHIVFDGLTLDRANASSGRGLFVRAGSGDISFVNGEVENFLGTGVCSPSMAFGGEVSSGAPFLIIRGNYIHDIGTNDPPPNPLPCNYSYGVYMNFDDSIIEGNTFVRISAFPIHGYPSPRNDVIRGNVFCDTGPILVRGDGNTVTDNRLYHVGQTVYTWGTGQTLLVDGANASGNNQVSDGTDAACNGTSIGAAPRKPAPRNLRLVVQ
jgi:hypothetical protein